MNSDLQPRDNNGQFACKDRAEVDLALKLRPDLPDLDPAQAPAGTYFVGDPCYAFSHDEWDEMLAQTGLAGEDGAGAAHMADGTIKRMWMVGTKYGDGGYSDDDGNEYDVDSGTLGLVPVEDINPSQRETVESGGKIVTFDKPVDISNNDGRITFGHITINTGDPDPEPCDNCGADTDGAGYCWRCGDQCDDCLTYGCEGECANCADCGYVDCACDDD